MNKCAFWTVGQTGISKNKREIQGAWLTATHFDAFGACQVLRKMKYCFVIKRVMEIPKRSKVYTLGL